LSIVVGRAQVEMSKGCATLDSFRGCLGALSVDTNRGCSSAHLRFSGRRSRNSGCSDSKGSTHAGPAPPKLVRALGVLDVRGGIEASTSCTPPLHWLGDGGTHRVRFGTSSVGGVGGVLEVPEFGPVFRPVRVPVARPVRVPGRVDGVALLRSARQN